MVRHYFIGALVGFALGMVSIASASRAATSAPEKPKILITLEAAKNVQEIARKIDQEPAKIFANKASLSSLSELPSYSLAYLFRLNPGRFSLTDTDFKKFVDTLPEAKKATWVNESFRADLASQISGLNNHIDRKPFDSGYTAAGSVVGAFAGLGIAFESAVLFGDYVGLFPLVGTLGGGGAGVVIGAGLQVVKNFKDEQQRLRQLRLLFDRANDYGDLISKANFGFAIEQMKTSLAPHLSSRFLIGQHLQIYSAYFRFISQKLNAASAPAHEILDTFRYSLADIGRIKLEAGKAEDKTVLQLAKQTEEDFLTALSAMRASAQTMAEVESTMKAGSMPLQALVDEHLQKKWKFRVMAGLRRAKNFVWANDRANEIAEDPENSIELKPSRSEIIALVIDPETLQITLEATPIIYKALQTQIEQRPLTAKDLDKYFGNGKWMHLPELSQNSLRWIDKDQTLPDASQVGVIELFQFSRNLNLVRTRSVKPGEFSLGSTLQTLEGCSDSLIRISLVRAWGI